MKPASEWQAYLVRKLPGAPLDAAIEKLQAEAWKAGAADMRERAARECEADYDDAAAFNRSQNPLFDYPADMRRVSSGNVCAVRVRKLPLTAPSGVPPTEPSGAPTEYSDKDSEAFG